MLLITEQAVASILSFPSLVSALQAAHLRPKACTEDLMMWMGENHYFTRHATEPGRYLCSKLVSSFPANRTHGELPTTQAVCVLFDGRNGAPLATIDGTAVTLWKTAAGSALGSLLLSRQSSRTLLVVGAGALAEPLVQAHLAVRPSLDRILIWNRSQGAAGRLAAKLRDQGLDAVGVEDLDGAVAQADIVTCCTSSRAPLVRGAMLQPGAHLDLIGGYAPDMREADDDAARLCRIFVDCRDTAAGVGDICAALASGAITEADILGDLYDLVKGTPGRLSTDDRTFFKNAGGGHLDLMTCATIYEAFVAGR